MTTIFPFDLEGYIKVDNDKKLGNLSYSVTTEKFIFVCHFCKGGHANFLDSLQIANPQILGLILQSHICKFLRCVSPQICND
jgi:hypothetical protein